MIKYKRASPRRAVAVLMCLSLCVLSLVQVATHRNQAIAVIHVGLRCDGLEACWAYTANLEAASGNHISTVVFGGRMLVTRAYSH
jgi:hypothetical protein